MIEAEITSLLVADPSVRALVGERIRPQELAPPAFDSFPYVLYEIAEETRDYYLKTPTELRAVTITYECWDDNYEGAMQVAETVSEALQPIIGAVNARYTVQGMFRERGPSTVSLPDHKGAAQANHGVDMDWRVVYHDTGAT